MQEIAKMEKRGCTFFQTNCANSIFKLKSRLPDRLTTDLEQLGILKLLEGSAFKVCNVCIKLLNSQTARGLSADTAETVEAIKRELDYGPAYGAHLSLQQGESYHSKCSVSQKLQEIKIVFLTKTGRQLRYFNVGSAEDL